ncbi:MAG TPA: hypothetical protein VL048_03025 [Xanthobacteraceae bacterium]|nr:hypothetical protein [Xanthobacteraceae bacterium]
MNPFDAVVTVAVVLAMALGFMSGLLRSLATILRTSSPRRLRSRWHPKWCRC